MEDMQKILRQAFVARLRVLLKKSESKKDVVRKSLMALKASGLILDAWHNGTISFGEAKALRQWTYTKTWRGE